jgi:thioredoxin reductase (NADPH)
VTAREEIPLCLYERVLTVRGEKGQFVVVTEKAERPARHVVVATGFFDLPNRLNVAGEDLPKVTHYYREPYGFVQQKVAIVGAKNSAAKAALDCYRHGAEVTLVVRGPEIHSNVKYWIKPDLENRIKEGSIRAFFDTVIERITERTLVVRTPAGTQELANDWVLAMTGYHPDYTFLESLGIRIGDDVYRTPIVDEASFESSRPGLYLAGTVCGGYLTNRWFIENGRFHAKQIAKHIAHKPTEAVRFDEVHWKTAE